MNTEDYVSFDCARLLKEKGCKIPTDSFYDKKGKVYYMSAECQMRMDDLGYMKNAYPRITLYEAQQWLRVKHEIIVNVEPYDSIEPITDQYNRVWYRYHIFPCQYGLKSRKYNKVFNAGIIAALELI